MWRLAVPALCVALPLVACGGSGAARPGPGDDARYRVVLGAGQREFEPLENDAHATLIHGPQGAYHVWTSFLSYGFDSDVLRMDISTGWEDTPDERFEMGGDVVARDTLDAQGAEARLTRGWPAQVREGLCQDGRALRVDLTISDRAGNAASDTRRWILDVPLELRPADCP
ncbi:MAG TPA: hypothetical protein VFS67_12100 [Polyangiaceae bacterium]|nr:hypothetical protein [Polyangiaceae bacterium]